MPPRILSFFFAAATATTALAGPPRPSSVITAPPESEWEFLASLPGWAAGLSGDVGVAGFNPVSVDVKFKNILDDLDMIAALTLEARHDR